MAAPTDPTRDTLTLDALKSCGQVDAGTGNVIQVRAETWLEELKADIWKKSRKKFKTLQASNLYVITDGARLVSCPSDFARHIDMELLQCTHYGVCQAGGGVNSVKLASDEDADSNVIGKEIIVYLTATKTTAYSGYITAINTTTKVATVAPAWSISPDSTYSYMIVDQTGKIIEDHLKNLDSINRGTPERYYPEGDSDYDQYYLDPVPYRTDGKPWAIREKYYANLLTVDLTEGATTLITKIYREWRDVLIEGLKWKIYEYIDDSNMKTAFQLWRASRDQLIAVEVYGSEISNLTSRMVE